MKGLLYKDCAILWRQGKMYLFIMLCFSIVPQLSRMGFAMAYAAILPYSVIAYDEQSKWGRLAIMLPYTDKQLVLSKYILSWAGMLLVMIVSSISRTVDYTLQGKIVEVISEYQEVILYVAASSLFSAIILPLVFRFGVERGRLAFILAIVIGVLGVVTAGEFIQSVVQSTTIWAILLTALLLAVIANIISVLLSQKFFRKGLRA